MARLRLSRFGWYVMSYVSVLLENFPKNFTDLKAEEEGQRQRGTFVRLVQPPLLLSMALICRGDRGLLRLFACHDIAIRLHNIAVLLLMGVLRLLKGHPEMGEWVERSRKFGKIREKLKFIKNYNPMTGNISTNSGWSVFRVFRVSIFRKIKRDYHWWDLWGPPASYRSKSQFSLSWSKWSMEMISDRNNPSKFLPFPFNKFKSEKGKIDGERGLCGWELGKRTDLW